MLSRVEHEKSFITSGQGPITEIKLNAKVCQNWFIASSRNNQLYNNKVQNT